MSDYKKKQFIDSSVKNLTSLSKQLSEEVYQPLEPLKIKEVKRKRFRKVFNNG